MSGLKDTATVTVNINGAQAKKMLSELEQKLESAKQKLEEMQHKTWDTKSIEKQRREVKSLQTQYDNLISSCKGVDNALKNVDKATPRELEKAIKTLKKDLRDMPQGSETWKSHTEKLQKLEAQLRLVRGEMQQQKSMWQRFTKWANDSAAAIGGLILAYSALVEKMRACVNDYAQMEEQMANTRKYTGMTEQQVNSLNNAFKQMDTRTTREQLNELAQEAGRLGKHSKSAVLGYVEAADILNVALVDLGKGATQEISKISNIFDVEKAYGTRDAMLKVGSTVNVLSQNCTASKPYIVEFTKRLAGVGAEAKLTIPQIMALAATLDANGQAVEMSATAVSRTIMMLFRNPEKIAKTVGLNVKKFTNTLKNDTMAGLNLFLSKLKKMGENDALAALSPLFNDLGMDGARMSVVLTTLANKLDMVSWETKEANKAFKEGTSASREYEIFNNTVQASIEKAKNRFHELSVELGERLYPIMKHVYTSGSAMVRFVLTSIKFIEENKRAILLAATALASYTVALKASVIGLKLQAVAMGYMNAITKVGTVLQASYKSVILLSSVAYNKLTGATTRAAAATKLLNNTLKSTIWGAVIGLIVTAGAALYGYFKDAAEKEKEELERQKKLIESQKQWAKSLKAIDKQTLEYSKKEQISLDAVYKASQNDKLAKEQRLKAAKELQKMYPDYFGKLSAEAILVGKAKAQYDLLTESILKAAKARAAKDKIQEMASMELDEKLKGEHYKKRLEQLMPQKEQLKEKLDKAKAERAKWEKAGANATNYSSSTFNNPGYEKADAEVRRLQKMYDEVDAKIEFLGKASIASNTKVNQMIKAQGELAEETEQTLEDALADFGVHEEKEDKFVSTGYTSAKNAAKEAREAAAEAKREQIKANKEYKASLDWGKARYKENEANNVVQYGSGQKTYEQYLKRKQKNDLWYVNWRIKVYDKLYEKETKENKKLLRDQDDEYQQWLLERAELEKSIKDNENARKLEKMNIEDSHKSKQLEIESLNPDSKYASDSLAKEEREYIIKLSNLMKQMAMYDVNSEEYAKVQEAYLQNEEEHMLKLRKAYAEKYNEWFAAYNTKSLDFREQSELNVLKQIEALGYISHEQYERQKLALTEKYAKLRKQAEQKEADDTTAAKWSYDVGGTTIDTRSRSQKAADKAAKREANKQSALDEIQGRLKAGLITDSEAEQQKKELEHALDKELFDEIGSQLDDTTKLFHELGTTIYEIGKMNWSNLENSIANIGEIAQTAFAAMNAGLETFSQFSSVQTEIDVAQTEKAYERKMNLAQGNSYKEQKLEKEKEEKLKKLKADSIKREYSVKVATAVAQTAQNAIAAYGAGWEMGPTGVVLAPLYAGIATATGLVQVALIKKQQKAAEAQNGYAEGGFTKPGGKYEPAGIVHAGEWVASQELLASPVARPLIEALDYAQRTNTIGSLNADDVSRSITAPDSLARLAEQDTSSAYTIAALAQNSQAVTALVARLNEPFVTVNTVSGDKGIKRAQDEYDQLIRNKTPKSRRK